MSSAYYLDASVVEGPDKGEYHRSYLSEELPEAIVDFLRLVAVSEHATLRWAS